MPSVRKPLSYLYQQRLNYDRRKTRKLIFKNVIAFGQTLIDRIVILDNRTKGLHFLHEGLEHISCMLKSRKGGLVISAHLGNWQAAGHMLRRLETPVNVLIHDGEDAQIKRVLAKQDQKTSFRTIILNPNGDHIFEVKAALERNELICLHADRYRPGNRTLSLMFLGKEALFPAGPFLLAANLDLPVCFVFALKKNKNQYHYEAFSTSQKHLSREDKVMELAKEFVNHLEREIRQFPEQWFNYYPFWNEPD